MSDKIYGPVDVVAVFNPMKEIKPLWFLHDGQKYKVDKLNYKIETKYTILFNCQVKGDTIVLCFDILNNKWAVG